MEQVAGYGGRGPNELAREAARLSDQLLQLRLEKGRMSREDMLLKEKVRAAAAAGWQLGEGIAVYVKNGWIVGGLGDGRVWNWNG